ncbi:MAG: glycosyltransferase family 4 protein, partial [Muribaculaceae bacterium]|nr:glycosyltransferase family 4 protein [Muribaculaceae bacterium]
IIATRHKSAPGKDNWLRRLIYRNLDAHIFVSRHALDTFLSSWPNGRFPFDSRNLFVIPNSRRDVPPRTPEPDKGAITAMYHGIIRQGKGLEDIIRALHIIKHQRLAKLRLRIAGTGNTDYLDTLRHLAVQEDVLEMIDWSRNIDDPATLISKCHFGVLPAVTPEAFGMANMEYMMAGRPQITTFNGAQGEYLTPEESAVAVPPSDPVALAHAMARLAGNPDLRSALGRNAARKYDTGLDWQTFIINLTRIYIPG